MPPGKIACDSRVEESTGARRRRGAFAGCDGTRPRQRVPSARAPTADAAHRLQPTEGMSPSPRISVVVVVVAVAMVATSVAACHKSSEQQAEEAAAATAVKEVREERAIRELERGGSPAASRAFAAAREAAERAATKDRDVVEAVTREQDRFRVLVTKELAWVDRRIIDVTKNAPSLEGTARTATEGDLEEARAWRQRLQEDLDSIDHPPAGMDWSSVKTRIDHDLNEDRPPSMPRMYEKPYGI
jgi:hypothetical protein